ncbi:hypothetical protein FGB62_1g645 [Gracilaria domingensis]|nr:hypothetical protein FGB62_1g645 [Gracilaria domingensis]
MRKSVCTSMSPKMLGGNEMHTKLKIFVIGGAVALSSMFNVPTDARAAIFHFRGNRPQNIGLQYGRYLQGCPASPNCISSMEDPYDSHYVPSWTYNAGSKEKNKSMQEAINEVTKVVEEYPQTTIITSKEATTEAGKGHYIYAEFESKLMGFVDDVEFFFQPDSPIVEYRSASRLGEGDFDANRKRIRDLRQALQQIVSFMNDL